jgi:hypothetical protein
VFAAKTLDSAGLFSANSIRFRPPRLAAYALAHRTLAIELQHEVWGLCEIDILRDWLKRKIRVKKPLISM